MWCTMEDSGLFWRGITFLMTTLFHYIPSCRANVSRYVISNIIVTLITTIWLRMMQRKGKIECSTPLADRMFHSGRAWRRVWLLASSAKPGFESAFPFWSEPNLTAGEKLWVQKHLIHSLGCWRPRQNLGRFLKHTGRFMKCDWTHESQGWPSTNLDSLTCVLSFFISSALMIAIFLTPLVWASALNEHCLYFLSPYILQQVSLSACLVFTFVFVTHSGRRSGLVVLSVSGERWDRSPSKLLLFGFKLDSAFGLCTSCNLHCSFQ